MSEYPEYTVIGLLLIALGIVALLIPLIIESDGKILEAVPPIILYVYRRDGFILVTSPILIIASILFFILHLANKSV